MVAGPGNVPLCEAEIQKDYLPLGRHLKVLRLDVAVDDRVFLVVEEIKRLEKLVCPVEHLLDGEWLVGLLEHAKQILAGDVLHHEVLAIVLDEMVADAGEGNMLEAVQQTGLAFDRFAVIVVHAKRFLDRDGAVETLVHGDIDSAHAPLADLFLDPISVLKDLSVLDHRINLRSPWGLSLLQITG